MTPPGHHTPTPGGGSRLGDLFSSVAGPVHVPSLTDAEREIYLDELAGWTEALTRRFAIDVRTIPPCWTRHNGMVEALSALRDHERACYDPTSAPTAAVDWVRALRDIHGFLSDLAAMTRCTAHEHRDPVAAVPANPQTPQPRHGDHDRRT